MSRLWVSLFKPDRRKSDPTIAGPKFDAEFWRRLLFLGLDISLVNLLFYLFLRACVLFPLKFTGLLEIIGWGAAFIITLYFSSLWLTWNRKPALWRFAGQAFCFLLFAALLTWLSSIEPSAKGEDYSWLRPEMIKVPLWLGMFIPMSPIFTAVCVAVLGVLMGLAIIKPGHRLLRLIPTGVALILCYLVLKVFLPTLGPLGDPATSPPRTNALVLYLLFFAGPSILFSLLFWIRWFGSAFRLAPLVFHMTMIFMNYIGLLPAHSVWDVVPLATENYPYVKSLPGVSLIYPPPGTDADSSFLFLRKMILTPRTIYVNYGPTCGLLAIDRKSGSGRQLLIPGLMRDLQLAPDGKKLWGLNWLNGDFLVIDPDTLTVSCVCDLFNINLTTPYNFIADGDRMFMTNVTHPIVAQLSWHDPADACSLKKDRTLDLHQIGFTKFTDGAFGMFLDRPRRRLYVSVGLVTDANLSSMAEIDVDTFQVTRDVKLTGGNPIFPLENRHHVLVPSYYNADLHEVSLDDMRIVRTIKAGPNVVSFVQDSGRGLFYVLCRAPGTLQVIEDATGRIVMEVPVGPKPEPIWLDRESDQLYLASGIGVLKIDLKIFLAENRPRQ